MYFPSKQSLRHHFLRQREALLPEERSTAARQIFHLFRQHIIIPKGTLIAGYAPIRSELDILPLLRQLDEEGYPCGLPTIQSSTGILVFKYWHPEKLLNASQYFAIPEPSADAPILIPDLIIAPLVACDKKGTRLGYGKGYYDHTLHYLRSKNPLLKVVGVCFSCQLAEKLPCDAHDERLDTIITEQEVIHVREY